MTKKSNFKSAIDSCIRDRNNKVVIWQFPNLPIAGWLLCMIAAYLMPQGSVQLGLASISTAFLIVWSYLEITQGVNYFRKTLGAVILSLIFISYFC